MRLLILLLLTCLNGTSESATEHRLFVSFSMPEKLFSETVADAARHHIPVILNGFYRDSMRETALKIMALSEKNPELSLQIDPTAFERYHITQVPALVADNGHHFDLIFGNITIERGLDEIRRFGDTAKETS